MASRSAATMLSMSDSLRRQHERAAHGAEALDRDRHRDDHLAAIVDAHHARLEAAQCAADLLVALAVLRRHFPIERQRAAAQPLADGDIGAFEDARPQRRRRQIEAQHVIKIVAVEDEHAVPIIDARPRVGRRDQTPEHRRHPFRIDREFEPGQRLLRGPVALAGLQIQQALGIDGDGVGFTVAELRWRRR